MDICLKSIPKANCDIILYIYVYKPTIYHKYLCKNGAENEEKQKKVRLLP